MKIEKSRYEELIQKECKYKILVNLLRADKHIFREDMLVALNEQIPLLDEEKSEDE